MSAYLPDSQKSVDYRLLDLLKEGPRADIRGMAQLYHAPIAGRRRGETSAGGG